VLIGTATVAASAYAASPRQDKSVWDGVYTEAQAKRGGELYAKRCETCHGRDLTGSEQAPSLAGAEFAMNWDDLAVGSLADRIRISMPQDEPGSLTRAQSADIVAYLLSKGGFPIGSAELPSDAPTLGGIKFLAKKP
jgi:S-disulfanyl-L-cysteine oxidoreductase SoxD